MSTSAPLDSRVHTYTQHGWSELTNVDNVTIIIDSYSWLFDSRFLPLHVVPPLHTTGNSSLSPHLRVRKRNYRMKFNPINDFHFTSKWQSFSLHPPQKLKRLLHTMHTQQREEEQRKKMKKKILWKIAKNYKENEFPAIAACAWNGVARVTLNNWKFTNTIFTLKNESTVVE